MYKILIFLKKTNEEKTIDHFKNFTLKYISEIAGKEVKAASVENNLLLVEKYSYFCELTAGSKEEMDKLMNSNAGRELNKDMMEFHSFLTVIYVNYENAL
jgi:hypothetical protein